MKFVDTHAHISMPIFNDDIENIINRIDENLEFVVIPSVDYESSITSINFAKNYPNKFFVGVGFQPEEVTKWKDEYYLDLLQFAKELPVVAIGEIGLDYYWDTSTKDIQHDVFRKHINLAREVKLPLILHNRNAYDDMLKILKEEKADEVGGIFHCFSGDYEFAKKCLDLGFYISFAGNITFKKAEDLRDIAKKIPLDRILIETDSPYLTPMPHRGKRNEPSYVRFVGEKIAEIKNLTLEEVAEQTTKNAHNIFKI